MIKSKLTMFKEKISRLAVFLVGLLVLASLVFGAVELTRSLDKKIAELSFRTKELFQSLFARPFSSLSPSPLSVIENQASPLPLSAPVADYESQIIKVVEKSNPSVVSIIVSKDLPVFEQYYTNPFENFGIELPPGFGVPQYRQKGTEKKEIGSGSGFIISANGLIATNKHVVADSAADYTVIFNSGDKASAQVVARDPDFDLAILKVEKNNFVSLPLGNSDELKLGQTAIAIGNALGEFKNTVSTGVISGLNRSVAVEGQNFNGLIQTDAAINRGNSGGPLLNLRGEVIGINTAMALSAENIGFAIPINQVKEIIEKVEKAGSLQLAYLGVYYQIITPEIQKAKSLAKDYGVLIVQGDSGSGIISGSPAEKAGLKLGDIILEIDNKKITPEQTLSQLLRKYSPGDRISLKVWRDGKELVIGLILGWR